MAETGSSVSISMKLDEEVILEKDGTVDIVEDEIFGGKPKNILTMP